METLTVLWSPLLVGISHSSLRLQSRPAAERGSERQTMAAEEAKVVGAVPPPPAYYKIFAPDAVGGESLSTAPVEKVYQKIHLGFKYLSRVCILYFCQSSAVPSAIAVGTTVFSIQMLFTSVSPGFLYLKGCHFTMLLTLSLSLSSVSAFLCFRSIARHSRRLHQLYCQYDEL